MPAARVPIAILAGSDRRPVILPEQGRDKHPLAGNKAVDLLVQGRPLVSLVIERIRASQRFDPIYVVGPAGPLEAVSGQAIVIDSDGTFGSNIEAATERIRRQHVGEPIAFLTCDVLPEAATLCALMDRYESESPSDLWFPLVRAPRQRTRLGASAWKPAYRLVPQDEAEAVDVLPGHLVIVDPRSLRLQFVYGLLQLGYRTRNRPISYRWRVMLRGVLLELLYQDLRHLLRFRAPTLTWAVVSSSLGAARGLRSGTITQRRLEDAVRKVFVASRHRRRWPERRVRLPIVDALWLALDIDTEEEAAEHGARRQGRTA